MASLSISQIVLIVVLILNLIIWMLVIFIRMFCYQAERRQRSRWGSRRRRTRSSGSRSSSRTRRLLLGSINRGFLLQEENQTENAYNISSNVDVPPSYEEATKYDASRVRYTSSQAPHTTSQSLHASRRLPVYEQSVVLSVPEEPTSTSETRLLSTLSPMTRNQDISANTNPPRRFPSALVGDDVSIGDMPFTFAVNSTEPQTTRTVMEYTSVELTDGQKLNAQSSA